MSRSWEAIFSWNVSILESMPNDLAVCRTRAHSGVHQSRHDRTLPPFCPWVAHVCHTRMTIMHTWITRFAARDILNRSRLRCQAELNHVRNAGRCHDMPSPPFLFDLRLSTISYLKQKKETNRITVHR